MDYAIWGLRAGGFLLTNVALHAASSAMLFLALARMTGAVWRPAFVAAVFAIHPLHVESVAWVAERKDVLSGLFWMLTLWAYARYVENPERVGRLRLALAFVVLGALAKPMVVTLPFVLLLLDYWPFGRIRLDGTGLRRCLLEKLPMFAVIGVIAAITVETQRSIDLGLLPFPLRLMNAAEAYVTYAVKSFWPTGSASSIPIPSTASRPGVPRAALSCSPPSPGPYCALYAPARISPWAGSGTWAPWCR